MSNQELPPFQQLLERYSEDVWRTLRAYPRLRPDSKPRAWLLTIAHNKAIDHLRRRRAEGGAEVEAAAEDPPAPQEQIWSAVAALPARQRAAVALRYIGDLSHREIAAAIGCSEEASRRSLHDGLQTLRSQL